jgi:NitT/TauT family transport system substrate-binding protein
MDRRGHIVRWILLAAIVVASLVSLTYQPPSDHLRVGHFPNLTHGQALIGREQGIFERLIGSRIDWKVFNAGPSEMEALLAGQLDLAYVGPNPAINAFMRSKGKALRIIAGGACGGAALVGRTDSFLASEPADCAGKKIAAPERGNTQDVALRTWLNARGLTPGTDVQIVSAKNPEIFLFFQRGQIDAAWVPEPWLSRLLQEANGRMLVDERSLWPEGKFPTAVLVARAGYLAAHRETVKRFLRAHLEAEARFTADPASAGVVMNTRLTALQGMPLPEPLLAAALTRIELSHDPRSPALLTMARQAAELGYLPAESVFPLARLPEIFDLSLLNDVLAEQNRPAVQ